MDCIFCKIVEGSIPSLKVGETTNFISVMDIDPVADGHLLIIPKKHSTNFLDFPEYSAPELIAFAQQVGQAVLQATGAPAFNFLSNNGEAAGQSVFHTHFHIIPRREKDGVVLIRHAGHKETAQLRALQQQILQHL